MCRCDGRDLRPVALCSLGCGLAVRAALQLQSEQWYVGVAAPEGGGLDRPHRAWLLKLFILVLCGR
jgi:hypothetical protein